MCCSGNTGYGFWLQPRNINSMHHVARRYRGQANEKTASAPQSSAVSTLTPSCGTSCLRCGIRRRLRGCSVVISSHAQRPRQRCIDGQAIVGVFAAPLWRAMVRRSRRAAVFLRRSRAANMVGVSGEDAGARARTPPRDGVLSTVWEQVHAWDQCLAGVTVRQILSCMSFRLQA